MSARCRTASCRSGRRRPRHQGRGQHRRSEQGPGDARSRMPAIGILLTEKAQHIVVGYEKTETPDPTCAPGSKCNVIANNGLSGVALETPPPLQPPGGGNPARPPTTIRGNSIYLQRDGGHRSPRIRDHAQRRYLGKCRRRLPGGRNPLRQAGDADGLRKRNRSGTPSGERGSHNRRLPPRSGSRPESGDGEDDGVMRPGRGPR